MSIYTVNMRLKVSTCWQSNLDPASSIVAFWNEVLAQCIKNKLYYVYIVHYVVQCIHHVTDRVDDVDNDYYC